MRGRLSIAPLRAAWRRLSGALPGQASAQSSARRAGSAPRRATRGGGLGRAVTIQATVAGGLLLVLVVIWAITSRGYFWPMWPALALAFVLAIQTWIAWVQGRHTPWLERRRHRSLAIHAGVWGAYLLFTIGIWAASGGGYFWPVWPMLAAVIERIATLETTRAGAVDVQEAELRRIERDLHDGAQARLVALGMSLGMAEQKLATDADAD